MNTEEQEAYDLGWRHGYDDELSDCPYEDGTAEHLAYYEGYAQGCNDC
jgi:hypothetical protein